MKITPIELKYKLWLYSKNGNNVIGDGRWSLLKAIEEEGSLQSATKKLGISYRKAWGDIKKMEESLGYIVVEKVRGGTKGGGSQLSVQGKKIIKAFEELHDDVNDFFRNYEEKFNAKIR